MDNIITIKMDFSFSGESYSFESKVTMPLHLDGLIAFAESLPRKIGRENGVDSYSYMHEVMDASMIKVTHAEGYITKFLTSSSMPLADFILSCNSSSIEDFLLHIVEEKFPTASNHDELHNALIYAYKIGESAGRES